MAETTQEREILNRYYRAMQAGAAASEEMLSLFAENAVYVEPFSGSATAHSGKDEIGGYFKESQQQVPPDMTLTLDQVEVDKDRLRTVWTCNSPVFPQPVRGQDLWTIRDGLIERLETTMLPGQAAE